jgi:hypothetical protein
LAPAGYRCGGKKQVHAAAAAASLQLANMLLSFAGEAIA